MFLSHYKDTSMVGPYSLESCKCGKLLTGCRDMALAREENIQLFAFSS